MKTCHVLNMFLTFWHLKSRDIFLGGDKEDFPQTKIADKEVFPRVPTLASTNGVHISVL